MSSKRKNTGVSPEAKKNMAAQAVSIDAENKAKIEQEAADKLKAEEEAAAQAKLKEEKEAADKLKADEEAAKLAAKAASVEAKPKGKLTPTEVEIMDRLKVDKLWKNTQGEYFTSKSYASLSEGGKNDILKEITR